MKAAALSKALIISAVTVLGGGVSCRGRTPPAAGTGNGAPGASSIGAPGTAAAAPAPAAPTGGKPFRIAMIAKSSTNPIFLAARTGAEAAAKEATARLGVPVEIVWLTPPQEDGQIQAQRIAQAVNEGANAILISCSDAEQGERRDRRRGRRAACRS